MNVSNITVIILTKNEEKRLPFILSVLAHRIPTIVFDGGSTDKTRQIASDFGAKFIVRPKSDTYGYTPKDLSFALDNIDTEYVFFANCSHAYSEELISKYIEVAQAGYYKAVYTGFINYRFGSEVQRSNSKKNCQSCVFYSKSIVDNDKSVIHNEPGLDCPDHLKLVLPPIDNFLIKINSPGSFDQMLIKNTKYARREVDEMRIHVQTKRELFIRLLRTIYIMLSMRPKNIFSAAFMATITLNIIYDLTLFFCSTTVIFDDQRLGKS